MGNTGWHNTLPVRCIIHVLCGCKVGPCLMPCVVPVYLQPVSGAHDDKAHMVVVVAAIVALAGFITTVIIHVCFWR